MVRHKAKAISKGELVCAYAIIETSHIEYGVRSCCHAWLWRFMVLKGCSWGHKLAEGITWCLVMLA
jgi:hypothetical protein